MTAGPATDGSAGAGAELGDMLGAVAAGVPGYFVDAFPIPPFLLSIYQAAELAYGVPWEVLAAINEIETNFGRDGGTSSAGAVGWMQFLPSTWAHYGVDATGDGRADPANPVDAIFSAGRYLHAAGAAGDLRRALFAYNHAGWYVDEVLARARLFRGLPRQLVGTLGAMASGSHPIAGRARYEGGSIFAAPDAVVRAVQDGTIVRVGHSERLGRFVMLRDAFGTTYTYGRLGSIARGVAVAKDETVTSAHAASIPAPERPDPAPAAPASARRTGAPPASATPERAAPRPPSEPAAAARPAKQRLFAHPARTKAFDNGGQEQLLAIGSSLPARESLSSYFSGVGGIERNDVVLRRLMPGRRVLAGTILGRLGHDERSPRARLLFEIRPAGLDSPRIDPAPILAGWRFLDERAPRAASWAPSSIGRRLSSIQGTARRGRVSLPPPFPATGDGPASPGILRPGQWPRLMARLAALERAAGRP